MSATIARKNSTTKSTPVVAAATQHVQQHAFSKTPLNRGFYINPSRTKIYLDEYGLNSEISAAMKELRQSESYIERNATTGEEKNIPFVPLGKLSQKTQDQVKRARDVDVKAKLEAEEHKRRSEAKLAEDIASGVTTQAAEDRKAALSAEKTAEDRKKREEEQAKRKAERLARGEKDPFPRPPRRVTEHGADIELLSKLKVRFSRNSYIYVSSLIDLFLHEQIEFAMNNVLKRGRSILLTRHVLEPGCTDLSLSCLYRDLPTYRKAKLSEDQRQKVEKTQAELKKMERKQKAAAEAAAVAASKATIPGTNQLAVAVVAVAQVQQQTVVIVTTSSQQEKDKSGGPVAFEHYVRQICNNIINEKKRLHPENSKEKHPFTGLRISEEFRQFMSSEIVEFIQRLAPLLDGEIKAMGLKTISDEVVEHTVTFLLDVYSVNSLGVTKAVRYKIDAYNTAINTSPVQATTVSGDAPVGEVDPDADLPEDEDDVEEVPAS